MKKLLLLIFVLYQTSAWAQEIALARKPFQARSGTARLSNWAPDKNTSEPLPTISSIAVKWQLNPSEDNCQIEMSMQWYLGDRVYYKGQEFRSPIITTNEIKNFSLITLKVGAMVYEGGTYLGKIVFDMGKTPPAGGTWGADIKQSRNWASVIAGKSAAEAKSILSRNISLSKLEIEEIEFGGTQPFKTAAFEKFYQKGQSLESQNNLKEAIDYYDWAAGLNTARSGEASNRKNALALQMKKFYDFLNRANQHYKQKEYYSALADYEEAAKIIPNFEQTQDQLNNIRNIINRFEKLDQEASYLLQNANDWRELRKAEAKFEEALKLMPVDRKEYITKRLAEVDHELGLEYSNFLSDGDRAFKAENYPAAAGAFQEATLIYPDREEAKSKLKETEETVLGIINKKYADKVSDAVYSRNGLFEQSAEALDETSERCHLEKALYYQCMVDYYNGLREKARDEMEAQLYQKSYIIPRMECFESNCQTLPPTQRANAEEYMLAAQRKDLLFREYGHASFQQFRDTYLDKSIQLNPRNPAAYTFKADLSISSIEKMEWLNKALSYDPQYQPALEAKNNIKDDFSSEVFEKIDEGDIEYLSRAVKNNLLRHVTPYQGYDVVAYAIFKDQVPALDFLLKNKGNLNSATQTNVNDLLYFAVENRASKATDYLIGSQRANVNYQQLGREPLLVMATNLNDFENVQKLLMAGANLDQQDAAGKTALDLAIEKDFPPIAEVLLSRYNRSLPDAYIFVAVRNNSSPVLGHLLRKGARVNAKDRDGNTPLHVAVNEKFSGISQTLVNSGAAINEQNNQGETALLLACKNGLTTLAQIMMDGRADINLANNQSETPLYWAIKNNMDGLAKSLLQRQATPVPALALAKRRNEQALLEDMAHLVASFGIESAQEPMVKLAVDYRPTIGFLEEGGSVNLLRQAIQANNLEAFKILLKDNEEQTTTENEYSAMHLAVMEKNMLFTQYLLDNLVNTTAKDREGASPLHRAVEVGFNQAITQLAYRFNIDGQDNAGKTPLHYAVEARNQEAVATLLLQGANKKIKDNRRWNAKKLARKKKFKQIKKML